MKWVPKICPVSIVSSSKIVPSHIVDHYVDDIDATLVAPAIALLSFDISWDSSNLAWLHEPSEMRIDLKNGSFYKFVGGDEEDRRLFYHVEGEGLSLMGLGKFGDLNRSLLADVSWDRKYIYCCNSVDIVPSLADLFSRFLHVLRTVSSDEGSQSSSLGGLDLMLLVFSSLVIFPNSTFHFLRVILVHALNIYF